MIGTGSGSPLSKGHTFVPESGVMEGKSSGPPIAAPPASSDPLCNFLVVDPHCVTFGKFETSTVSKDGCPETPPQVRKPLLQVGVSDSSLTGSLSRPHNSSVVGCFEVSPLMTGGHRQNRGCVSDQKLAEGSTNDWSRDTGDGDTFADEDATGDLKELNLSPLRK